MPSGGGLLQLVALGKQDIFLTGNPQTTWFKSVYRRYTNFAVESQSMYFDGDPDFGKRLSCLVQRRGDLLGPLVLEVTLPALTLAGTTTPVPYVNSIGHMLIEQITLEIGENEIDTQTGEWMELWTNLTVPASKRQAYNEMLGRVEPYIQPSTYGPTKVYIPLQFWFCKNPGSYLPLLALQFHPIRINLKLRRLQDLFYTGQLVTDCTTLAVNPVKITDLRLWGDYVYLDVEERRRFVANPHEYLIEQVQYTPPIPIPVGSTTVSARLEFNHPIRELIWVVQRDQMQNLHEWFNYSSTSITEVGRRQDLLATAVLQLDGFDRFEVRDAGYFRLLQPMQHHTTVPQGDFIYVYSFALQPEDLQPTGSMNASRIDNLVLQAGIQADTGLPISDPNYVPARGNSHITIFATNDNVLRIVNGFGGLLFKI
jgi:Major capsid protein N-terminus/Large eukaryotic DNA virus major capsid protein